jgi:hypothetical protein
VIEGAQGDAGGLKQLPIPEKYMRIPPTTLDESVRELAQLYAAHSDDRLNGTHDAPDFGDAVRMHKFIDQINLASESGKTQVVRWR